MRDEPLVWQLGDPARLIDVRRAAPSHAEPPTGPCPVFLCRTCDPETDAVQSALRRLGIGSVRIEADRSEIDLRTTAEGVQFGVGTHLITPTVIWVRHFSPRAAPAHPSALVNRFAEDSWYALLSQLGAVSAAPVLGTGPGLLRQLAIARAEGVRVPETIVTTRPASCAAHLASPLVVLKSLGNHAVESSPGLLAGVFAQVASQEEAARWSDSRMPLVLQEYVEHETELRVYVTRGEVHAFRVVKSCPEALWLDGRSVSVQRCRPPEEVVAAARRVAAAMELDYAAMDFLISQGEPVLLEANPDGDWRWFEAVARSRSITVAATRMIAGLHRRAGAGRLDLTRFLIG